MNNLTKEELVCRSKKRYPDELTARANVSILCEQFNREFQCVYFCNVCRGWHCTTREHSQKYRVSKEDTFVRADRKIVNNNFNKPKKQIEESRNTIYVSSTSGEDILKEILNYKKEPTPPIRLV